MGEAPQAYMVCMQVQSLVTKLVPWSVVVLMFINSRIVPRAMVSKDFVDGIHLDCQIYKSISRKDQFYGIAIAWGVCM